MSRGHELNKARKAAVDGLGRTLSRRARNRCELCGDQTSLQIVEVSPKQEDPDPDRAVMVCARCAALATDELPPSTELRFLGEAMWSETLPVQVAAVRTMRKLAARGDGWAVTQLDGLYLEPEAEELLDPA